VQKLNPVLDWIKGQFPAITAECADSSQENDRLHQAQPPNSEPSSSHVDPSCSTDSTDLQLPSKHKDSDQAVTRALVARMEQDENDQEDSTISARTEEGYDAGTESASSHNEDDVFSQEARSNRSSLNSCTDGEGGLKLDQRNKIEEGLQSEHVLESCSVICRIPSTTSSTNPLFPEPLTITSSPTRTTSRRVHRPSPVPRTMTTMAEN
jgi:hypothetical protein